MDYTSNTYTNLNFFQKFHFLRFPISASNYRASVSMWDKLGKKHDFFKFSLIFDIYFILFSKINNLYY